MTAFQNLMQVGGPEELAQQAAMEERRRWLDKLEVYLAKALPEEVPLVEAQIKTLRRRLGIRSTGEEYRQRARVRYNRWKARKENETSNGG